MLEFFESEFFVVIGIIVFLLVIILSKAIVMVPQGYNYTLERFGRYVRTLKPGIEIIIPIVERVGYKLLVMEQFLDVPTQEVISRDNATIEVDGVVFFQILDARSAAYEVDELNEAILNLTTTNIRTVMGSLDLDHLLSQRDEINGRILSVVDAAVSPWGAKVTRVEIKDIRPPSDLVESMARQMKAEREKRAQILEAEGLRQAAILTAEGKKQAQILEAEGNKEAAFRDAEARERMAKAESLATKIVSDAISTGNLHSINYFIAEKYVEAIKTIGSAPNQKIIMMPLESSAVIGSLAGIAEIAKNVFENDSEKQPERSRTPKSVPSIPE